MLSSPKDDLLLWDGRPMVVGRHLAYPMDCRKASILVDDHLEHAG
jgi:hypothetical protein